VIHNTQSAIVVLDDSASPHARHPSTETGSCTWQGVAWGCAEQSIFDVFSSWGEWRFGIFINTIHARMLYVVECTTRPSPHQTFFGAILLCLHLPPGTNTIHMLIHICPYIYIYHHPRQPIESDRDFTIRYIRHHVYEIFQIVVIARHPDRKRQILKYLFTRYNNNIIQGDSPNLLTPSP